MEKEKKEMIQFFMAEKQLQDNTPHLVKTPEGWKPFSEQASKGFYPNNVNDSGAKVFFESAEPEIKYASRPHKEHCDIVQRRMERRR